MSNNTLPEAVPRAYGLWPCDSVRPGGGTAGNTWRIAADGRQWFIRRRGARTSAPERVRFDHGLRRHLAERGYPTASPLLAADGATCVRVDNAVYEAYPLVPGQTYSAELADRARRPAARALAHFHSLAHDYPAPCEPLVPQYTSYPVAIAPRPRFDDPAAQLEAVDFLIAAYATAATRAAMCGARDQVARTGEAFDAVRDGLPRGVVHGDYNCFNLLFDDAGEVTGVFDFDWAWREIRLFDIARGAVFFGCPREGDLDPGSIWSLTRCPRFDIATLADFLDAYTGASPEPDRALTDAERRALPLGILAQWASWRIEGAMKVSESRRAEFFLYGFFEPYAWFETHGDALLRTILPGF